MLCTLCVVSESNFFLGVGGGSARPCANFLAFCCSSAVPLPSASSMGGVDWLALSVTSVIR